MLTKNGSGFLISCDFCSSEAVLHTQEMADAIDAARRKGWSMQSGKQGGVEDRCPCCTEKAHKLRARPVRSPVEFED